MGDVPFWEKGLTKPIVDNWEIDNSQDIKSWVQNEEHMDTFSYGKDVRTNCYEFMASKAGCYTEEKKEKFLKKYCNIFYERDASKMAACNKAANVVVKSDLAA